jgi:hypothetical protein
MPSSPGEYSLLLFIYLLNRWRALLLLLLMLTNVVGRFYPGQAEGRAIADVLFGDYNPAGRIPVTFPQHVGQLPMFYNYKPSARKNQTSVYADGYNSSALYHFGHGLSYTKFACTCFVVVVMSEPHHIPNSPGHGIRGE